MGERALWTTPRAVTNAIPFSLVYGSEAVIPLEVGLSTHRTVVVEKGYNDYFRRIELLLADSKREEAIIRIEVYQQQMWNSYNKQVRERKYEVGELILRKVTK